MDYGELPRDYSDRKCILNLMQNELESGKTLIHTQKKLELIKPRYNIKVD